MSKARGLRRLKRSHWKSLIAENCKTSLNQIRRDVIGKGNEGSKDNVQNDHERDFQAAQGQGL